MRARQLAAARAVWGGLLVVAAWPIRRQSRAAAAFAAALGARHLVQAAVAVRGPDGVARWVWTVDVVHGVSMLVLAGLSPRWRRLAVAGAAEAATWTCATRTTRQKGKH